MDDAEKRALRLVQAIDSCDNTTDATAMMLEELRQAEARGAERAYELAIGVVFSACQPSGSLFGEIDYELRALAKAEKAKAGR